MVINLATFDAWDEHPKVFKFFQWQMSGFFSDMWGMAPDVHFIKKRRLV